MTTLPDISVLLPVRDAAPFLGEALACLRAQQGVGLQVVAVDDGSRDASPEILARWADEWPELEVVEQERLGVPAALEAGRSRALAPWIGRMDADDRCPPDRFARLLEMASGRDEPLDVVGSQLDAFGAVSPSMESYLDWQNALLDHRSIVRSRFVESPLAHATALIRSDRLAAAGGWDIGASWSEDLDLWYRLVEQGARFGKVDRVLYHWRQHDAQATRLDPRCSAAQMRACKAHYLARGPLKGKEVGLWAVGQTLEMWTEALTREGCSVRPHVVRPPAGGDRLPPVQPGQVALAVFGSGRARDRIAQVWAGSRADLWFAA